MPHPVTACVLIIGNEILSGRTQDTNLAFLATELNKLGIQVNEARVIADDEQTIIDTLNHARKTYSYVFTTGGIGPTHDDITASCVAKAFGTTLERTPEAVAMLESHYEPGQLNEARLKMAETPVGSILIENPISKAPGFQVDNVFVLAGVPKIAQALFDNLKHRLAGGKTVLSQTISVNCPEGQIAEPLAVIQGNFTNVDIGSYPYFRQGHLGVSLVIRSTEAQDIQECGTEIRKMIIDQGGDILECSDIK